MRSALCALLIICQGCASTLLVDYHVGNETGKALVCRPQGNGPFPTVIYSHGLIVDRAGYQNASARGYDLDGFCHALAKDGFLAFVPIRGTGVRNIPGHAEEVSRAIDYVKTLPEVDPSRIALMGFSRGGLLTLMVGVKRDDLQSLVILAPAPGRGHFAEAVERVPALNVPVLLLVEASDEEMILEDFALLKDALQAHRKEARIIRYDQGGGHRLFWGVDYYWKDVTATRNTQQYLDWLAKGRYPIATPWSADRAPHPNTARVLINWLLSREGQIVFQKKRQGRDSLRIDIPKDNVREDVRRRKGVKYSVLVDPKYMDLNPIRKLVKEVWKRKR